MSQNLCVIDIGTNAVKCKLFSEGRYSTPQNKFLSNEGSENLNKEEVIKYISEFIALAKEKNIDDKYIYIAATEAFRTSSNQKEIQDEIKKLFDKKIHMITPKQEARFSVIGGLKSIRFKGGRPKQVLFVESGGGSTEISLVDLKKRPLKIVSTLSLPLGSKRHLVDEDDQKTKNLINQKIKEMLEDLQEKGVKLDPSIRMVVNSSAASRIIAKKNELEEHNAFEIAKQQDKISLMSFIRTCKNILEGSDSEKLMQDYWLKEEVVEGFKGHTYILKNILESLKKEAKEPFISRLSITTTIGGLKEGLMDEMLKSKKEKPEEIEKEIFKIGEEKKKEESEEKETGKKEKAEEDLHKKEDKKEEEKPDTDWIDSYEDFYKKRNDKYTFERNEEDGKLKVSDGQNEVTYTSSTHVDINNDKTSRSNRLYEDMILLAQEKGIEDIKFDKDVSLETKLRIYAACKKHNMKIKNFIYNPKMLEGVSSETKKIVLQATQKTPEKYKGKELD